VGARELLFSESWGLYFFRKNQALCLVEEVLWPEGNCPKGNWYIFIAVATKRSLVFGQYFLRKNACFCSDEMIRLFSSSCKNKRLIFSSKTC
jgi:hypothetical protein